MLCENYYILTGAPGVGKTTLLELLKNEFKVVNEPARRVISDQKQTNGNVLWDKDRDLFITSLLNKSIHDYRNLQDSKNINIFFDRGIPDCVAYALYGKVNPEIFKQASRNYLYNNKVFILNPWEEIYRPDNERTISFNEVKEFHKYILDTYNQLGYELINVPEASPHQRLLFIKSVI